MKLYSVAVFVGTLLALHTANAIPGLGLRYLRSSLESANRYRIRDTVPNSNKMNAAPPTEAEHFDVDPQAMDRVKPQLQDGIPQASVRPEKLPKGDAALVPEEALTDTNYVAPGDDDESVYPSDLPPQTTQNILPTDVDYPKRKGDGPAFADSEFSEDTDEVPPNSISQSPALKKLKMYAGLTSVLANIARIPHTVALQIESVISGLQSTYPVNTNVGAYMMGTRFLLRNPRALKPFDMLDQAGFGRLPDLVSSMPSIFLPIINSVDRVWERILRRVTNAAQRFAGAVRRVTEGARSLAGVNFARGMDSYSISVPNAIDMVLKGQLANRLDELFAYLQRLLGSGLSSVGSAFGGSNPANDLTSEMDNSAPTRVDPARNEPAYRLRSPPRFSARRDYYRPSRYYSN